MKPSTILWIIACVYAATVVGCAFVIVSVWLRSRDSDDRG